MRKLTWTNGSSILQPGHALGWVLGRHSPGRIHAGYVALSFLFLLSSLNLLEKNKNKK